MREKDPLSCWREKFEDAEEIPGYYVPDKEALWKRLQERMQAADMAVKIDNREVRWSYWVSRAAAFLLFIGLFFMMEPPKEEQLIGNKKEVNTVNGKQAIIAKQQVKPKPDSQHIKDIRPVPAGLTRKDQPLPKKDILPLIPQESAPILVKQEKLPEIPAEKIQVNISPVEAVVVKKAGIPDVHISNFNRKVYNSPMARSNQGRRMLKQAGEEMTNVSSPAEISDRILIQ